MTFLITIDQESGGQIVRLAGWLESDYVTGFQQVVCDVPGPFRLDLTELRSADSIGVSLLREPQAKGVALVGASPFVRRLVGLETAWHRPAPGRNHKSARREGPNSSELGDTT